METNDRNLDHMSITQSIIGSFKEIKAMREGRLPERSLKDFFAGLDEITEEELAKENEHASSRRRSIGGNRTSRRRRRLTIYSKKDDSRVPSDEQIELLIRNLAKDIK